MLILTNKWRHYYNSISIVDVLEKTKSLDQNNFTYFFHHLIISVFCLSSQLYQYIFVHINGRFIFTFGKSNIFIKVNLLL